MRRRGEVPSRVLSALLVCVSTGGGPFPPPCQHWWWSLSSSLLQSIIQPTDQRGETPTNLSPRVESPVQPSAPPPEGPVVPTTPSTTTQHFLRTFTL